MELIDTLVCNVCSEKADYSFIKYNHPYYKCRNCGLVFTPSVDPALIITENDNSKGRNNKSDSIERLRRIVSHGTGGKNIIDFGCGEGLFKTFVEYQGYTCIGIDKGTEVQLDAIETRSIDAISIIEVIEHLYNPDEVFAQFRRVLKPGGLVYAETSVYDNQNQDPLTWWYCDPRYGHCTMFTLQAFSFLANKHGFIFSVYNPTVFLFKVPL